MHDLVLVYLVQPNSSQECGRKLKRDRRTAAMAVQCWHNTALHLRHSQVSVMTRQARALQGVSAQERRIILQQARSVAKHTWRAERLQQLWWTLIRFALRFSVRFRYQLTC